VTVPCIHCPLYPPASVNSWLSAPARQYLVRMTAMNYRFCQTVRSVVDLLVAAKYEDIERATSETRLTAVDIARVIQEYGRVLIAPPDDAYEDLDVVQVQNVSPARWSVRMNLWTAEEGRSDLSLELTIVEGPDGHAIELDDIHVL